MRYRWYREIIRGREYSMIFVFEMNKYRKFVKIAESVMKFEFVLSRYLEGFMRVGGGMMRFVFGVNKNK